MQGVIFEGPDASGKTTLVKKVHAATGRPLYTSGGAPKDIDELWVMVKDQTQKMSEGYIFDRISAVSQQVYREGLLYDARLTNILEGYLAGGGILVYCRPPMNVLLDPKKHEWKQHDTEEWKTNVLTRQHEYVERYDRLMARIPCIIYDWTSEESTHLEELLKDLDTEGVSAGLKDMMR